MDLSKKINTKKIIKKINLNKYSNIHFIFAAGYLENFSKKININDWKKAFNVNFFSHLEILNSFLFQLQKIKKESRIIFFSGGGAANSFP